MENIYDETRLWYAHLTSLGYKNAFGTDLPLSKATFPQNTVENFINMFKPAYEAIAPLKTFAPERYQILYDRILKEELAYRHILLEAYSSNMTPQQLASEREFWKTEVLRLGFNKIKEFGAIETVWANW